MSLANPTQLHIGSKGILNGVEYSIVGRVVMSVVDGGGVYYWNEFHMVAAAGEKAILVYEETQRGGEWRYFTMFEPDIPVSIESARAMRLGGRLNLDGAEVHITFLGKSNVSRIEGKVPEGEYAGKEEHYFNAEAGNKIVVLSWTSTTLECYHGFTLGRGIVEKAFGIPKPALSNQALFSYKDDSKEKSSGIAILAVFFAFLLFIFIVAICKSNGTRGPAVKLFAATPPPLTLGSEGTLAGKRYKVTGYKNIEIAEVGLRFERHEYILRDDDGHQALLVCGDKPDSKEWNLYYPLEPGDPLTPQEAGGVKLGQAVNCDGFSVPVSDLFLSTERITNGTMPLGIVTQDVRYGFSGEKGTNALLIRWNARSITFHRGTKIPRVIVTNAFN